MKFRSTARPKNFAAFTVLEVMFASIVLSLAIVSSITSLQVGYRMVDTARCTTLAGQVLQSMVEDIRMLTYSGTGTNVSSLSNLTDQPLSAFDSDANNYESKSITDYSAVASALLARFRFSRTITDSATDMKKIVLSAKWTGIDGKSHTVTYTTYYARNGLYAYYIR